MLKLFYIISRGIAPESADIDARILSAVSLLEERGFIMATKGRPEVLIPCLSGAQAEELWQICD